MFLAIGAAYGIPAVALRFFNVYGERQALSNPYTGVAAAQHRRKPLGGDVARITGNGHRDAHSFVPADPIDPTTVSHTTLAAVESSRMPLAVSGGCPDAGGLGAAAQHGVAMCDPTSTLPLIGAINRRR